MSLTMGTCPVRGGSALIKCADPNCIAYINQVSLKCAAVSRLVLAYIVQMRAAKGSPARDGSGGGARPPALLCRRHKVIQRLWPVVVLVRAVRRPPRRATCCNRVHAPHSPPLGLCARAAIMPRCKGGLHMRTLRAGTAGHVRRRTTSTPACQKSSRAVCTFPCSPGLTRDAARAHAQSSCCGSGTPPCTPCLTRGVASQCPSTIHGRREAGPTARAKRESVYFCTANVLTSKQRSATSSTVMCCKMLDISSCGVSSF